MNEWPDDVLDAICEQCSVIARYDTNVIDGIEFSKKNNFIERDIRDFFRFMHIESRPKCHRHPSEPEYPEA